MKKEKLNPDKPKKPANNRMVVRVKCVVELVEGRRPGNKPGGYPAVKSAPVIKCVPKGVFRNNEKIF